MSEFQLDYSGEDINKLLKAAELLLTDGAGTHNSIYRGKNLGTSVTAQQYASIADGTFKDLYIGDYWTINDINWQIAAFDYYFYCGKANGAEICTTHHVVIVPDIIFFNRRMNGNRDTSTGYANSEMYTSSNFLPKVKSDFIEPAFGDAHLLTYKSYLTKQATNGIPSSGSYYDCSVELMSEIMVYGTTIFATHATGTTLAPNTRTEKTQLPLFAFNPSLIAILNQGIGQRYWLRDIASEQSFANVGESGSATSTWADSDAGVRPYFCLKG